MIDTVLQVYEEKGGRLHFRSDIPLGMPFKDKCRLIERLVHAMKSELKGPESMAVSTCIRQLALGAAMCAPDMECAKLDFREDIKRFL